MGTTTVVVKKDIDRVRQARVTWGNIPDWMIREPHANEDLYPDMRHEMHVWLYGDLLEPPRGPWVIHREMLLDQTSPHWSDLTKESYQGYRWLYKDHLIRARRPTYPTGQASEEVESIGITQVPEDRFFVEWCTGIKKEDYIITLTKFDFLEKPTPNLITIDTEYAIIRVDRVEGDLGRIEYLRLSVKKSNPNPELSILRL